MHPHSISDEYFIDEALRLAKKAMGWTNPNPMVGAVIVKKGQIIARGYHKRVGLPHAEIEALTAAKTSVKGATLYVNLEPCSHYGRTPPCVEAIIQAGIKRVVCSALDLNPKVRGRGIAQLQQAGITVTAGLRETEAKQLNETFFTFHEHNRPFIALKFAASLDGKIATATGDSKWITNEQTRAYARKLRSHYQAVLVGINTVLKDNPHLGIRLKGKKDPLRIVLDATLKIPLTSQVLRDPNVLIATTVSSSHPQYRRLQRAGYQLLSFPGQQVPLPSLLAELAHRHIISVLVEGGSQVLGSFIDAKLVDKVYAFHAPILIGGEKSVATIGGNGIKSMAEAVRLKNVTRQTFDDNVLTIGYT